MLFDNDVKLKAQVAVKPFLEGDYPAHVKNPVLLLNYLNQHAIIPRPNYNTIATPDNSLHAVSCKIGDFKIIGKGSTTKIAKTHAAQLFLDYLLDRNKIDNPASMSVNGDHTESCWSSDNHLSFPFNNSNSNGDGFIQSVNWIQPLNYDFSMENCISSNGVSETFLPCENAKNTKPTDHHEIMEVQRGPEIDDSNFRSNASSINFIQDQSSSSSNDIVYAEPQCDIESTTNFIQAHADPVPHEKIVQVQPQLDEPPISTTNTISQSTNDVSAENLNQTQLSPATYQTDYDSYFDPFFKQRPTNSNNNPLIMETDNITNNVQEDEQKPVNVTVEKSNSNVNGKSVFALLQKKTQKHLKLIPRFRIENNESGYYCTVQLGSYFAQGEGKKKKEAKTNAAISLLHQMEDLN